MLKTIDKLLLNIWKLIESLLVLTLRSVKWLFSVLKIFPGCIFRLPFLRGIAKAASKIKESRFSSFLGRWTKKYTQRFSEKMHKSAGFRRVTLMIFAVLLFLYIHPPSHWGPWYKYQEGIASHYGPGFWFKRTANGEIFIPWFYTAAHKTLPLGITAKVVNPANGKTVYVKINDRGPFIDGRIIDLSTSAAKKIGLYKQGIGKVIIYTHEKYDLQNPTKSILK